jgi:hypothetical protein
MSFLFGSKEPKREEVAAEEKKKIRSGSSKSTILTGPLGLVDNPLTKKKLLLGK